MLIAAALLLVLTGLAHSYLGERDILIRLFKRDNVPKLFGGTDFTTGTLRSVWHPLTIDFLPLFFTCGRYLSWIVFFVVAALLWLAAPGA